MRKPLILYGARQVGKTWLLKEFGKLEYKQTVYLNFDEDSELSAYFEKNLDTERIISALESHFSVKIKPEDTLLIFDELQECQRAKDSLKYFNENAPQYHIAAAGSFWALPAENSLLGKWTDLRFTQCLFMNF